MRQGPALEDPFVVVGGGWFRTRENFSTAGRAVRAGSGPLPLRGTDRRCARDGRARFSQHNHDLMHLSIFEERDGARIGGESIHLRGPDTGAAMLRIQDRDPVGGAVGCPLQRVLRPSGRNARFDAEGRTLSSQSDESFDGGLVHPTRRPRVPRPAASSEVHRMRIDIRRDRIRLATIPLDVFSSPHVVNRIDHMKQFHRFVAQPQACERDDRPERGVRVLAAVLPHAWNVALDVPGSCVM